MISFQPKHRRQAGRPSRPWRGHLAGLLSLACLICGSPPAKAAEALAGLRIEATSLQLKYPTGIRDTRLSRLEFLWHERLNSWLDGQIRLGTQLLSQSSNPLPAGQSTHGQDLGLGLVFRLYQGQRLQLHADADYRYTDCDAQLASQQVTQRWHQVSLQLQGDIHVYQFSYLSLAVGAMAIDGEEVATGTVNSVTSFHSETPGYARLGFSLGLDPDSYIGLEVSAGSMRGGYLTFQRWF